MTPTARTLAACRKTGRIAEVVERWIPRANKRKDLFGFIDIVVLDGLPGVLGIQCTSGSNVSARVKKIREECWPAAESWLRAENRIEVWGWRKKAGRWGVRIVKIEEDLCTPSNLISST